MKFVVNANNSDNLNQLKKVQKDNKVSFKWSILFLILTIIFFCCKWIYNSAFCLIVFIYFICRMKLNRYEYGRMLYDINNTQYIFSFDDEIVVQSKYKDNKNEFYTERVSWKYIKKCEISQKDIKLYGQDDKLLLDLALESVEYDEIEKLKQLIKEKLS